MPAIAAAAIAAIALGAVAVAGCGGGSDAEPPGPEFARGPYLTRVTETGARLDWRAPRGAPVALTATAPDGTPATAGGRTFSSLRPDTRYAWTATLGGVPAARGVVHHGAAGSAPAPRPDRLRRLRSTQRVVARRRPPRRRAAAPAARDGVVGDHDIVFPAGQRALVDAFDWPGRGERYELRYGPVQIVALGLAGDRDDAAFLRRALAMPEPRARLVVTHQPLKAGNPLLPVIAAADVTAVLAGHLHAYERREVAGAPGVPFITVGTGGAPRNDERTPRSPDAVAHLAEFGVMRVRLQDGSADFSFIDLAGRERDRLTAPLVS